MLKNMQASNEFWVFQSKTTKEINKKYCISKVKFYKEFWKIFVKIINLENILFS